MDNVLTIPEKLTQKGKLVIIPRSEYEEFLNWKKIFKIFKPTVAEKKDLKEARKDFAKGKYITLAELNK